MISGRGFFFLNFSKIMGGGGGIHRSQACRSFKKNSGVGGPAVREHHPTRVGFLKFPSHPGGLLNFYMRQNVAASKCRIDTISGMAICRIDTISSGARLCHIDKIFLNLGP